MQLSLDYEPQPAAPHLSWCRLTPRDYQQAGINRAFELWDQGNLGVIFRQPTGTGKTISGIAIADLWLQRSEQHRVIVIAHERQLIWQFAQEIEDVMGFRPGIEMANEKVAWGDPPLITVASRASLPEKLCPGGMSTESRLYKFDPIKYKWLVIHDECHRWAWKLKSCKHIIEWFERGPDNRRLGLTATPERGDRTSLGRVFPSIASDYRLYDPLDGPSAVKDGWAVSYDQRFITVEGIDFKNLREVGGDFDEGELERILSERETLLRLIRPTLDLVGNRKTLIFSPTVAMAKAVSYAICAELADDHAAKSLDGSVADYHRRATYLEFENPEGFQFLSVCGLCVAGGTLVLTDRGNIPIEEVTRDMRLWDGVEFVPHDGVISKGVRPVIEYAGLKATEDHDVWTANGWRRFAACKQLGIAISVSAIGGKAVRESCGYYRGDHSTWQEPASWAGSSLRWLWQGKHQGLLRAKAWKRRLQAVCEKLWGSKLAADALSFSKEAVRESCGRILRRLWWAWNRVPVCIASGHGTVDHGEHWAAQGINFGPDGQQQALRAWKYSVGQPEGAGQQSKTAEVYDILNAGPRHRFTANGLIVSNCREGYNNPNIGAIAIYRPTKSRALAEQMKGRGCRPLRCLVDGLANAQERLAAIAASAKPSCMVIDMVGVSGLADTATTAHILAQGLPDEDKIVRRVNQRALEAAESGDSLDIGEAIKSAKREIDAEKAEAARKAREAQEAMARAKARLAARIQADVRYSAHQVEQGHGAGAVHGKRGAYMPFGKYRGWKITDMPSGYLRWLKENTPNLPKWLMASVDGALLARGATQPEPATAKQIGWLKWRRQEIPRGLTKYEASRLIQECMKDAD